MFLTGAGDGPGTTTMRRTTHTRRPAAAQRLEPRTLFGAHTLQTLATFTPAPLGATPTAPVYRDASGTLWGTTPVGGSAGLGTVYRIASGTLTTVASFTGTNGATPYGGLVANAAGDLFGFTSAGGPGFGPDARGTGTVFEIAHGTAKLTTLATFAGLAVTSVYGSPAIDAAGNLYGLYNNKSVSAGGLFKVTPAGAVTLVAANAFGTFTTGSGSASEGPLIDASGNLFVAATQSGTTTYLYELPAGGTTLSTVATISAIVYGLTADAAGDVFATTYLGATAAVYKFAPTAGAAARPAVRLTATATGSPAVQPVSPATADAAGDLFWVNLDGFNSQVVELAAGASSLTVLAPVAGTASIDQQPPVTVDASGDVFVVAPAAASSGAVLEVAHGSNTATTVATFGLLGPSAGTAGLAAGPGGLYGFGSALDSASSPAYAYRVTPGSPPQVDVLFRASGLVTGFMFDAAGNGFAIAKMPSNTLVEWKAGTNVLTPIATVPGTLAVVDDAGDVFGAVTGGLLTPAYVYEVAAGSTSVTTLATDPTTANGYISSLAVDAAGDVFGVAGGNTSMYGGHAGSVPSLFEIVRGAGAFTYLTPTTSGDTSLVRPTGGLVVDAAGDVFGYGVGPSAPGLSGQTAAVLFERPAKATAGLPLVFLATLPAGEQPSGPLALDSTGNLFGASSIGGGNHAGAVYELPHGAAASFDVANFPDTVAGPSNPVGALVVDASDDIYGTATNRYGGGSAYALTAVLGSSLNLGAAANYVRADADGQRIDIWTNATGTGTPAYQVARTYYSDLTAQGAAGASVTVDFSAGNPLPDGGLEVYGTGPAAANVVRIVGGPATAATAVAGEIVVNDVPITYADVAAPTFDPGTGPASLTVAGGTVLLPAGTAGVTPLRFSSVAIGSGARVVVARAAGTRSVVVTDAVGVAATGTLDLGNSDLIVTSGTAAAVSALAATGFAGGRWNGPGLVSGAAADDGRHLTAVGVVQNTTGAAALYTTFDGVAVTASAVLARTTYYGDANLDGSVTAADYTRVDVGAVGHLTGWANGDFNYDGVIDGTDYALTDNAFNQQGAATPAAAVVAVAKPAAVVVAAPPAVATWSDPWWSKSHKGKRSPITA